MLRLQETKTENISLYKKRLIAHLPNIDVRDTHEEASIEIDWLIDWLIAHLPNIDVGDTHEEASIEIDWLVAHLPNIRRQT